MPVQVFHHNPHLTVAAHQGSANATDTAHCENIKTSKLAYSGDTKTACLSHIQEETNSLTRSVENDIHFSLPPAVEDSVISPCSILLKASSRRLPQCSRHSHATSNLLFTTLIAACFSVRCASLILHNPQGPGLAAAARMANVDRIVFLHTPRTTSPTPHLRCL